MPNHTGHCNEDDTEDDTIPDKSNLDVSRELATNRSLSDYSSSFSNPSLSAGVSQEPCTTVVTLQRPETTTNSLPFEGEMEQRSRNGKLSQMARLSNTSPNDTSRDTSMRSLAKRTLNIGLPGLQPASHKALFLFSEENAIRKYAKIIIEWGYPFS
ncbi:hypothetical protein EG68_00223 [Paragonimus skrjabini miyazakii]|uniref:Uncharacterized protein n=1 Tax=Paragonimus skrjabini miyazakii TaxID=59628 RepID=A0A8S9ZCH0_9TREM|nr:hypothetical protein EG68_00223 [Paragonimus skrjabini miyazakii]